MPKRRRPREYDRRELAESGEEETEEQNNAAASEQEVSIDIVAFCTACGINDPAAFSKRMLHKRGRHGERIRRCRACVSAAEASECGNNQAGMKRPSHEEAACAESEARASAIADIDRKRKKLLKSLRQIEDLKRRRQSGDSLEQSQAQKIEREAELQAELRRVTAEAFQTVPAAAPAVAPRAVADPKSATENEWVATQAPAADERDDEDGGPVHDALAHDGYGGDTASMFDFMGGGAGAMSAVHARREGGSSTQPLRQKAAELLSHRSLSYEVDRSSEVSRRRKNRAAKHALSLAEDRPR
jgi:hypothetical protein